MESSKLTYNGQFSAFSEHLNQNKDKTRAQPQREAGSSGRYEQEPISERKSSEKTD